MHSNQNIELFGHVLFVDCDIQFFFTKNVLDYDRLCDAECDAAVTWKRELSRFEAFFTDVFNY